MLLTKRLLLRSFSTLIRSSIKYQNQLYSIDLKLNSRLSSCLIKNNVPLPFQCQEMAECGTCAIVFDNETFDIINAEQPLESNELVTLGEGKKGRRLACKIRTTRELEGKVIDLDLYE